VTIDLFLRRPLPADYLAAIRMVDDDVWAGRGAHLLLPRLWFEHFAGTSLMASTIQGEPAGFLAGFASPDHPREGVIVLAGTSPTLRRRGVGRRLHEQFLDDMGERGIERVIESVWPGDPAAVAFLRALGFRALDGPGTARLYGTPAFGGHEWGRDDRAVFVREMQTAR
jgi:ribosomal protein S18 acetylase RimI-like enzyme